MCTGEEVWDCYETVPVFLFCFGLGFFFFFSFYLLFVFLSFSFLFRFGVSVCWAPCVLGSVSFLTTAGCCCFAVCHCQGEGRKLCTDM